MNMRDHPKVRNGYDALKKARAHNRRGDFEDAGRKYLEAAKLLREEHIRRKKEVWGAIFLAERKALRIFEVLVKRGRHDLYETYRRVAEEFFEDWPEWSIKRRLRYRGLRRALIERNIRLSEFERICADEWLKKPESEEVIRVVVDCYKRAAEALQALKTLDSRRYTEHQPNMHWYWSNHYKFAAFEYLQDKEMQEIGPEIALEKAGERLSQGIEEAEKSVRYDSSVFHETHLFYLKYWHAVVYERLHLLRFLINEGRREDWELSSKYWQEALHIAESKWADEESLFFPNRFYSIKDLKLEDEFLKAAFDFRHQDWKSCTQHLENWCRNFPVEYYLTWRHIQGYIRLLVAAAFQAFMDRNQEKLSAICRDLTKIREEPIGKAGDFLCYKTCALLTPEKIDKDISISENELFEIQKYFPFDSYREYHLPDEDLFKPNPLLSLPPRIRKWIEQAEQVTTNTEIPGLKVKFFGSIEAFLGYLYDYYCQELSHKDTPDLDWLIIKHNLERLIEEFYQFMYSKWSGKRRKELFSALTDLKGAVKQLFEVEDIKSYIDAYYKACKAIFNLTYFFPVVVKISAVTPSDKPPIIKRLPDWQTVRSEDLAVKKPRIIQGTPNWSVHDYRPGRGKFFVSIPVGTSLKPDDYYLPPDWRKGIGIFYQVGGKQPLIKARFQPRWKFWESRVGTEFFELIRENSIIVLGKYGKHEEEYRLEELEQVRDYLLKKGYSAYLVKNLRDTSDISTEDKSIFWMRAAKFCVMIDRIEFHQKGGASGYLDEYVYAKDKGLITAILQWKGLSSTSLMDDARIKRFPHIRFFTFENSPLEKNAKIIDDAVEWAKNEIKERERAKKKVREDRERKLKKLEEEYKSRNEDPL